MLVRTWRNWNRHALLMGMENASASVENNLTVPQKVKYKVTVGFNNSTPRRIPQRTENKDSNRRTNLFIATLLRIVKRSKQSKCPSMDEWIENFGIYIQRKLFSHKN